MYRSRCSESLADEDANRLMGVLTKINLVLSDAGDPSSFPERLWSQSRDNNSFFDKYFLPSCGSIESAVAPGSGEHTCTSRVYMDLVRIAVMKPFSTKVRIDDHDWSLRSTCSRKSANLHQKRESTRLPGRACRMQRHQTRDHGHRGGHRGVPPTRTTCS